jgi:hypothetical protein
MRSWSHTGGANPKKTRNEVTKAYRWFIARSMITKDAIKAEMMPWFGLISTGN